MQEFDARCSDCDFVLSELANFVELTECPECGSANRSITIAETAKLHEQIRLLAKDPGKAGKKKVRREVVSGDDLHVKSGKWNKKVRIIDVDNDHYFEEVTDPESGEVIHLCDEPLSKHQNHGSAKLKRKPKAG